MFEALTTYLNLQIVRIARSLPKTPTRTSLWPVFWFIAPFFISAFGMAELNPMHWPIELRFLASCIAIIAAWISQDITKTKNRY